MPRRNKERSHRGGPRGGLSDESLAQILHDLREMQRRNPHPKPAPDVIHNVGEFRSKARTHRERHTTRPTHPPAGN